MDSFQGRHFTGGGGGGDPYQQHQPPQQNPFPNPYHHPPQPTTNYSYPPPPPHHHPHHYPSPPPPPPTIPSQHQQQQQQWVHPESHLQHHHPPLPPLPPPYPQPMPPYAVQSTPPFHNQYHPHPPLPAPHHVPLPPHQHRLPSPPPPSTAYPPPPQQQWTGTSWAQHQGWEYPERNLSYNTEDDWATRAKAWAAAKSVTDNHQVHSQVMPVGRMEEHSYTYHDQIHNATGPPLDAQQSSLSQSINQQLPNYALDQQKQVNHSHVYASFPAPYVADSHMHYNAGEEAVAPHKDHNSPARNFGSTSSIYEKEVPYSYSSVPAGNRDAVNQFPLPVLSAQEGFIHPQAALTDASNKPLDFEPRPASEFEPHTKVSYGPADPTQTMGLMDRDATAMSVNAWTPTVPGVFPQVSLAQSVTQLEPPFAPQPSLGPHPSPVYGRLPGPNFRPGVPPTTAPFGLVTGTSLNQAPMFPADASGPFNISERPKKAAVPNWLREEIIKNKSVIASTYASHQSGSSHNSMGSEDDDKSYRKADQADKSVDSAKSTDDDEDDEDDAQAARSAAINQEIKRVLTEVLLKVTDELFDEIATKVLNEDDPTAEVGENKELGNNKIPIPIVSEPKASANVLTTIKENQENKGVSESTSLHSPGGDILGLASYASDEEDDADGPQISKPSLVQSSNGRSSGNEPKNVENEIILNDRGEPVRGSHDGNGDRVDKHASQKSNARNHVENSLSLDASIPDGKLHNHAREHKSLSGISSHDVAAKCGLASEFSSDDPNSPESKAKTIGKGGVRIEYICGNNKDGESVGNENLIRDSKIVTSSNNHPEGRSHNKESVKKGSTGTDKTDRKTSDSTDTGIRENKSKLKENINLKEISQERGITRGVNARDNRMGSLKDKKERDKEDTEGRKEKARDEKEGNSRRLTKDLRHNSRRSPSPNHRGRNSKENSLHGHGSISSDEPSEISKKRRLQSRSPSPTRSRTRQVSRSPHRKHSHRRHSPYSSERRRSRSTTPVHRRR
ncbi:unnamed protein product [Musa acuminata var. zebrina]